MSDITQGEAFDIVEKLKANHPRTYARIIKAVAEDDEAEANPIPVAKRKEMETRYKALEKCKPVTINFRGLFAVKADIILREEEFELEEPEEGSVSLLPEKVTRVQVSKLLEIIDNMLNDGDFEHWQNEIRSDLEGSEELATLNESLSEWLEEAYTLEEAHEDFDVRDIVG